MGMEEAYNAINEEQKAEGVQYRSKLLVHLHAVIHVPRLCQQCLLEPQLTAENREC